MRSSPRFNRGTSVIAALVFAALLGAVVLGMNALQSGSTNTSALPAQAAAAQKTPTPPSCQNLPEYQVSSGTQWQTVSQSSTDQACVCYEAPNTPPYNSSNAIYLQLIYKVSTPNGQTLTQRAYVPLSLSTSMLGEKEAPSSGVAQNTSCQTILCHGSGSNESCQSGESTPGNLQSTISGFGNSCASGQVAINGQCFTNDTSAQACLAGNADACQTIGTTVPNPGAGGGGGPYAGISTAQGAPCVNAQSQSGTYDANGTCVVSSGGGGGPYGGATPPGTPGASCTTTTGAGTYASDGMTCTYTSCYNGGTPPLCTAPANPASPNTGGCTGSTCNTGGGGGSGGGAGGQTANNNNGLTSALNSLLTGLAKGLASPCTTQSTAIGGNGTGLQQVLVPNGLGGYTTTYVQTQSTLGSTPCGTSAPYGVGTNGVACSAPPAAPACPSGQTAEPISATGNGCVTSYQCVNPSTFAGAQPSAQLSCSPQVADVGQSVTISYACSNATDSSASGFVTNDQTSGSTSTVIQTPPSGTNTANFGLTCINNDSSPAQNASASCSVQINTPSIVLVANPQNVQSGETSSIGWVTSGMQSCVISSPTDPTFTSNNASNTNVNGSAQTDAITTNTTFTLTCQTLVGGTQSASTVVTTGSGTSAGATEDITASSTADGQTVNHGNTVTISWTDSTSTSNAAISLWLIDLQTEEATALIASGQPLSGSYQWQIPAVGSTCSSSSYAPCASELVDGNEYGIEAALYTPSNAYLGPAASAPSGSTQPTYTDYGYTPQPFTIGQ